MSRAGRVLVPGLGDVFYSPAASTVQIVIGVPMMLYGILATQSAGD